jgi:serine/threonine protein kinase
VTEDEQGRKVYTFAGFPAHPFRLDHEYEVDSIKGWGTFGLVASGRNTITGQPVAVKRVNQVFDNLGDAKRILREIKILSNSTPT